MRYVPSRIVCDSFKGTSRMDKHLVVYSYNSTQCSTNEGTASLSSFLDGSHLRDVQQKKSDLKEYILNE
jgi:hypothetical protein